MDNATLIKINLEKENLGKEFKIWLKRFLICCIPTILGFILKDIFRHYIVIKLISSCMSTLGLILILLCIAAFVEDLRYYIVLKRFEKQAKE